MISINATLVVQIVNFLILMVILDRLLFKPILQTLKHRQDEIMRVRQEAMDLTKQGEDKLVDYNERLEEAKTAANLKREEIRSLASAEADTIVARSLQDEIRIVQQIRSDIAEETARIRAGFQKQAEALSAYVTRKVLGRELK